MKGVNLEKHWGTVQRIQKVLFGNMSRRYTCLGTTISSIPEDTLSMIETVAKQCADKMGEDGSELDEAALMKTMQGMLGGMMKK